MSRVVPFFALVLLCLVPALAEARVTPRLLDRALTPPAGPPMLAATYDSGGGATREEFSAVVGGFLTYACGISGLVTVPSAVLFGVMAFSFSSLAGGSFMIAMFAVSAVVAAVCVIGFVVGLGMVLSNAEAVLQSADKPSNPSAPPGSTAREAEAGPAWARR